MQNWKDSATSTIYLANGGRLIATVYGISPEDGSGYVLVHDREIRVSPLPDAWSAMGYGEIVAITLQTGQVIEAVLTPDGYTNHVAYLSPDESSEETICLFDTQSGTWREMTAQEYEKERRARSEDAKDMQQDKQEWQEDRES